MTCYLQRGYAFVAMPMDRDNHALVDVLEAIKAGAKECGITAERIDDDERSERITDRMLESIRKAEFVIVDLSYARPNVFFEAGYAHGIGKIPILYCKGRHRYSFRYKGLSGDHVSQHERTTRGFGSPFKSDR
jgi:nucleoside 2-deoxyribosyltransferase